MINTCVRCGKEFESIHKTAVCPDCGTTAVCVVCGKEFELKWPYTAKTCSSTCRGILRKESGQGKEIAKKAQKTVKQKYDNPVNVSLKPKKCAYCGKMFIPNSNRQKYCGDDYGNCPVCGKLIKIKDMNIGPQACSMECRQVLIEQTNLEKYGVKNTFQSEEAKEKSKETCLEKYGAERYQSTAEYREKYLNTMNDKYGVDAPLQNKDIKEKWTNTNLEKYNTKYPTQNKEVQNKISEKFEKEHGGRGFGSKEINSKIKETMIENYGVQYPLQSEEIKKQTEKTNIEIYGTKYPNQNDFVKQKIKNTNNERYGGNSPFSSDEVKQKVIDTVQKSYGVDNVFQSDKIKEKIKETNLEKYGYENAIQNPIVKQKIKNTNFEKYGVGSWKQSDEALKQAMTDPSKIDKFKEFKNDCRTFIKNNFTELPTLQQIANLTGVKLSTISVYIINNNCEDLISYNTSNMEVEIKNYIKSLISSINIITHDRKVIAPLELDIYLPDYNFAIECNPTYTHNSTNPSFKMLQPMPMTYHKNKSTACKDKDIFLFHVFGYEWTNNKEIILSMIKNILGKNEDIVYGRNTTIKEITQFELDTFLNRNHRQGTTNAKIRLGLFNNSTNELVSVMSFNHLRNSIGTSKSSTKEDIELSRFCNKLNTTVIGGASKLFKYFMDNYEYNKIISFSDIAHTKGTMYKTLGFKQVSESNPSYVWVNSKTDLCYSRVKCQKRNLRKLFNEPDLDIENKTESEIMTEHGFVKVYDCGVIRWEYEK